MKKIAKILSVIAIVALLMGSGALLPTAASPDVTVSIDAPDTATPGSDFTANVNISEVTDFDACQYDVSFNASVLQLDNVTAGEIGSTPIPVDATNEISTGTYRVVQNVSGLAGVSGSGYLAVLHFSVIGSDGESSDISLSNGVLSDKEAQLIPATWLGDTVTIEEGEDTTPPTVVSVLPADGATGVAVDTVVTATFSEAMDETTITTSSFTLDGVSGSVSYNSGTYTATFTPSANLEYSTTYTAALSTAITDVAGNPLASVYSWDFTTVMASLEDQIDATPPGGTLTLGAGTYTGNVTIDKPITISGTAGTIIMGSITISALTGSSVTIENLTITGYTDFGIKIIKVNSVDTFLIRNNTIQGVAGSIIGIEVDEVVTGGTLIIERNSISGNQTGIKLLAVVADATIQLNDITNNATGLEILAVGSDADASYNWWSDISGPEEASNNPGGVGNKVVGNIDYQPWLTRQFQTVLADNIAYFGFAMVSVDTGWNVISTPIALDPTCDTWGEYVALGDGLNLHATSPAYYFDSQTQAWVALTSAYALKPCDAIYVRMASADIAPILYSPDLSVPSKQLRSGWNLVSLAYLDGRGLKASEALVSVEEVSGGLAGYKLVVSPPVNQSFWIYTGGTIADWNGEGEPPDGWMMPNKGYWVFMLNDGILAGFAFTPVSLDI
jgi:hypothetical protein